jgi:hypothetical protein
MPDPRNVEELLARIQESYWEYSAAIAAVPEAMQTSSGPGGSWSVRDVMAHVGADERWFAGQLEALLSGSKPTALSCYGDASAGDTKVDLSTQDKRNAWQYERLRRLSLADVRSMARASHDRLLALIESLNEADFVDTFTIADNGNVGWVRRAAKGEEGWPLWEWLRGVTYQHYAEHTAQVTSAAPPTQPVGKEQRT